MIFINALIKGLIMSDSREEKILVLRTEKHKTFCKFVWVDKRQRNGEWSPAFPAASQHKEEEYIQKMIKKDREAGY